MLQIYGTKLAQLDPTSLDLITESVFTKNDGWTVYLSEDTNAYFVGGTIGKIA
jgi:hypothetical protein